MRVLMFAVGGDRGETYQTAKICDCFCAGLTWQAQHNTILLSAYGSGMATLPQYAC
jgi:hypothetical protein